LFYTDRPEQETRQTRQGRLRLGLQDSIRGSSRLQGGSSEEDSSRGSSKGDSR